MKEAFLEEILLTKPMPLLKDVMMPIREVVAPDASTTEAAQKMKALNVGALPVCNGQDLIGMVTAGDLVSRVMALRRNPDEAPVREAMRQGHLFCYEDDDTDRMEHHGEKARPLPAGFVEGQADRGHRDAATRATAT